MRKKIRFIICLLFFLCFIGAGIFVSTKEVYAADALWYEDYEYYINKYENYLVISKYKGNASKIYVPAYATIDGVVYQTQFYSSDDSIWGNVGNKLTELTFEKGCITGEYCAGMFRDLKKLKKINPQNLDTSRAKDFSSAFAGCKSLTSLDLSTWDMSNVEYLAGMFVECTNLEKLDVSTWDVSKVSIFFRLFDSCESLVDLDISKWNTQNATYMVSMFDNCKSLGKLNLANWDVSNVDNMMFMFHRCESLKTIDLHKWNVSKVKNMFAMFQRCYSLETINLKGWNTSKVTDMDGMFANDWSLKSLDLSSFDMSKVKFEGKYPCLTTRCDSLVTIKTPKKLKQNINLSRNLTYVKKTGKTLGTKRYTVMPKGNKSITLVCTSKKTGTPKITSVKSSGKQIKVKWNPVTPNTGLFWARMQYEVQISENKNFKGHAGTMVNAIKETATCNVQLNVTEQTEAAFKGLKKGKTYYVRVRACTWGWQISKWSKVKKYKYKL